MTAHGSQAKVCHSMNCCVTQWRSPRITRLRSSGSCAAESPDRRVEPSDVTFGPEHVWLDRAGEVHLSPGIEPSVPELGPTSGIVDKRSSPRRIGTGARRAWCS